MGSADPGDDPGALSVLARSRGDDVTTRVEDGQSKFQSLRQSCEEQLSIMGNHPWGTVTVVVMLSEALNLGLIIMSDIVQLQGSQNQRWIFGLNLERADFPHWLILYNLASANFQLLMSKPIDGNGDKTCVFSAAQVPDSLRAHWKLCNERRYGSHAQGGVS